MTYEGIEKRQFPRVPLEFSVEVRWGTEHRKGFTGDVSAGGAFLRIPHPPPPDSEVLISMQLNDTEEPPVILSGTIAWSMDAESARANTGCGVRWVEARCRKVETLKKLLHETLKVQGGFAKAVPNPRDPSKRIFTFVFPEDEVGAPVAPSPGVGHETSEDTGFSNRHRRVNMPVKYIASGKTQGGVIVMLGERRVIIESEEVLPSHSDRLEIRASIDSSGGSLPITIQGQVSRIREATLDRPGSFWMLISQVDERGKTGLFKQYLRYLATLEE